MTQSISSSPEVIQNENPQKLTFPQAISEIIKGKKITKLEWKNREIYGILLNGYLRIHKTDGIDHEWLVSEGDLLGDDYIVI